MQVLSDLAAMLALHDSKRVYQMRKWITYVIDNHTSTEILNTSTAGFCYDK